MQEIFDLEGKIALVTGGSRGIGKATALRLADAGARVVVTSRKLPACEAVVAEIEARHGAGRAIAVASNLSDKASLQALHAQTLDRLGPVDILVCNAAVNPFYGAMADIPDEAFRKILDSNIIANNWLVQLVAPAMRARKDGVVVIISSIGGLEGSEVIGAYNISKAADMQMARNLAVELGPDNIRVNCIAPGLIRTDFARALWENKETLARYTNRTPLRRIGAPDEIAGSVVFLASKAGAFMTGQVMVVDGGTTISGI